MSFERLQERLTALQDTTTQLRELIDRVAQVDFQPGSVPLETDEENSVSGELSAEITQILRNGVDEQELLNEDVKFARPEGTEKANLQEGVERIGAEFASCRSHFRKARLAARQRLLQARELERRLLLQSYSATASESGSQLDGAQQTSAQLLRPQRHTQSTIQRSSLSEQDQQTVGASNNVTNALRRTHDLIAAELYRSEYAHQTLSESSAALKQLNESYTSLDSMLASSRDLLGTLLRSQKSDTWYLQTALYMLMTTGAWLLFRRLLYGPMWWLVWLPLRVVFGVGSRAGSAVMYRSALEESGSPGIAVDGPSSVDGLPSTDLPTVQVTDKELSEEESRDAAVESIAKIVDAVREADDSGSLGEGAEPDTEDEAGNPKKRTWEEPQVAEEEGAQHRDEL